jgi:signal transduction histidine kinase/CheY-like chemotaxis protein
MPAHSSTKNPRPLRFRLFLLAASGLVPLALVLLLSSAYLAQERRTETQQAALELSRALATAVDAELRSTVALLENFAIVTHLPDLEAEDLLGNRFAPLAARVTHRQGWRLVVVANADGEVVARAGDTTRSRSERSPVDPQSMARVLGTQAATVGAVTKGPQGGDAFAVRVPVFKENTLRYVLSGVVPTEQILNVIARQQLPPLWVVAVYDEEGNRVARSRPTTSSRYSPSLEALVKAGGRDGMGVTRTLEGVESQTGFTRVGASRWTVAVGIPTAEANADLYRLLAAVGAGTAASLGLLAWLAWRTARSISGPIAMLKQAAAALGAGKQVELPRLGVQELDDVGLAVRQAATDRDEANAHRDAVQAERELLLARLEEALRLAEAANRNKDEFLALLGHELRNPLAPIMNAVHLIGLKDADQRTAQERNVIQRQLNYVTRLVDDLLDASRITSSRFRINQRPLRPVAVLEQTVDSLRPMLGGRELSLEVAQEARSLWIHADEARLVQIFNNLLGNAIKFTSPAGVIEVRARAAQGAIEVSIRDDGVGMAAADLERAFDLFYQAPDGSRGVNGGLGLGLAIVKSLVQMHSGTIKAESDGPGRGAQITVRLPVTEPPAQDTAAPVATAAPAFTKVLIVDDNQDAADTLAMLLGASGFDARVAYDPRSAIEAVDSFRPTVAVLDIGLPQMDGYELARHLRSREPRYAGALIALTGYGQQKDVDKALEAGFDAHLTKPVEPDALLQLIAKILPKP